MGLPKLIRDEVTRTRIGDGVTRTRIGDGVTKAYIILTCAFWLYFCDLHIQYLANNTQDLKTKQGFINILNLIKNP